MKRFTLLILICFLAFSACKKDNQFVNATIHDETAILSGCEWVIEISSVIYSPKNLPDEFKVDGKEVEIKYDKLTSKKFCQIHPDGIYEISIKDIR
jgi:hypothetical protein